MNFQELIVLVVDDSKEVHMVIDLFIKSFLKNHPDVRYTLHSAFQGEDGIRMYEEQFNSGKAYAIVFMDIKMPPGIDGIEALEKISTIDPNVNGVVCTAFMNYSHDEAKEFLSKINNAPILYKPFEAAKVNAILADIVKNL